MRRPAQPAPAPTIATAERLERVRTHTGFPSQRAFWQRIVGASTDEQGRERYEWPHPDDAEKPAVSYEAMRTYHFHREAPAAYLARVAHVFPDIRLEWLVTDEGEMTHSEQERRATEDRTDVARDLRRRLPDLNDLPYTISVALLHHLDLWERAQAMGRKPVDEPPVNALDYAAGDLWPAITAPLHGRRPADFLAFAEYIVAALHARNLALLLDTYAPETEE